MTNAVVIGLAQWYPLPGQPEANEATAFSALTQLARAGCDIAVLPELWLCGYRPSSLAADARTAAEPLDGPVGQRLAALASSEHMAICAGSLPERREGALFNTAVLYDRSGDAVLIHSKAHLYGAETGVFEAGTSLSTAELDGFGRVGICICFDGDFPESGRALRQEGARVVFHPSAYEADKESWWETIYPAQALCNGQWWISCNQHGGEGSGRMLGDSRVVDPSGVVRARAARRRPAPAAPDLLVVTVPLAAGMAESDDEAAVLFEARRPDLYRSEGSWAGAGGGIPHIARPAGT